ncbi:hypothetical protein [Vibrio gazogenes]|uniref:hypothetical protein n=1 Tax=Vibrio gazogenes TaxID=687 RepID=UPI00196799A7|nr:hypothetical protein [Vibrio gazogenes]
MWAKHFSPTSTDHKSTNYIHEGERQLDSPPFLTYSHFKAVDIRLRPCLFFVTKNGEVNPFISQSNFFMFLKQREALATSFSNKKTEIRKPRKDIPHQLSNRGHTDLHFVVTSTPPSHGDRVEKPA